MNKKEKVDSIRSREIVLILENALNYGEASAPLYLAAMQEIIELRNQVRSLGGVVPDVHDEFEEGLRPVLFEYDIEQHY